MPEGSRRILVCMLLLAGAVVSSPTARAVGPVRWLLLAAAVGMSLVPGVHRRVFAALDRLRNPSPRTIEWTTLAVGVLSTAYFVFTAMYQDRDLVPKTHDEGSYVLQMHMLAGGRLWMPQHPLADFFDTFYVLVRPVYASLYFPGAALMYTPTVWLGWPTWAGPVIASGAVVALTYRLVTELIDGAAGLLAALLMVSLSWFRMLSVLVYSHVPMLLLGLLLVWAYLRWRREGDDSRRRVAWLVAIGALGGWGAITRPVDALCYAIPVGAAIACDLWRRPVRAWAVMASLIVAGAAPFLALQAVFNKSVTGSFTKTPYTYYLERDQPRTSFGFHPYDPTLMPESRLPQKREYYREFMARFIREHQPSELWRTWKDRYRPQFIDATLPAWLLVAFVPVGLLGARERRRWVLLLPLPLLLVLYALNTFFLEHYAVVVAPSVLLAMLLGMRAIEDAWPRWRAVLSTAFTLALVTVAVTSLYELNPLTTALDRTTVDGRRPSAVDDETFPSALMRFVNEALPYQVQKPAVVLFRYRKGDRLFEEPVYNSYVAWPDDAPVIRAHDLGERNAEIIDYYARRQPERMFYLFDRSTGTLTPLGRAAALRNKSSSSTTTSTTPATSPP